MSGAIGMLEAGGIAPPREHLELGDRVAYHHRACVLRIPRPDYGKLWVKKPVTPRWAAVGVGKFDRFTHMLRPSSEGPFGEGDPLDLLPTGKGINKTIYVWPEEGEGCLIGMVRRGIGHSVGPSGGGNFEDYEPGWFETREWHWLYVIKLGLAGIEKTMVLTPMWATRRI